MKIAFIGYGNMAISLASRWVAKHDIFVSGRDTKKAQNLAGTLGNDTHFGSGTAAAAFGEVVVLATPHEAVFDAIDAAGGRRPSPARHCWTSTIRSPITRVETSWSRRSMASRYRKPSPPTFQPPSGQGLQRTRQGLANGPACLRRSSIGRALLRRRRMPNAGSPLLLRTSAARRLTSAN